MRKPRIKVRDRTAVYHCVSRCVGGQFLFQEPDREKLRSMIWKQAQFCGLEIITHSELSNHFHVVVRVPLSEISDQELLCRVQGFYGPKHARVQELQRALADHGVLPPKVRQAYLRRMGEVSVFMKELKQGFSRWYNRKHDSFGTLWAERFRSELLEDQSLAVGIVAAYVDLNAVRAGLVPDPKDYRFCGYGEAVGGHPLAQAGLLSFLEAKDWIQGGAEYRQRLFVAGATSGKSSQVLLDREQILEVVRSGGQISCAEALRLRIRYLRDGLVLGSEEFVNGIFQKYRHQFGPKRKTGARRLRGLPFSGLRTLRDLRVNVLG